MLVNYLHIRVLRQLPRTHQTLRFMNKLVAEFIGTFWLVLGGCGSAV